MISRIPVKVRFQFDPSRLDFHIPVVGVVPALLGFALSRSASLTNEALRLSVVFVLIVLAVQYFCFNLFHLDGLLDTADAFLGTFQKEKRLAILKDSRVGVYGFFAGICALSLKAALLWAIFPHIPANPMLCAWPIFGRLSAALVPCLAPPQREDGLGALAKNSRIRRCILGLLTALVLCFLAANGLNALAALLPFAAQEAALFAVNTRLLILMALQTGAAFFTALFFARLYEKALGGYSGDALGAAIEVSEIIALAIATLC